MKILLLLTMIFLHIVDDFYLQGILAKLKTQSWWEENVPEDLYSLYQRDYIAALVIHAFSWTFMMMLPVMIITAIMQNDHLVIAYTITFAVNVVIHAWTDHLKANVQNASLLLDQTIHLMQILLTWYGMTHLIEVSI